MNNIKTQSDEYRIASKINNETFIVSSQKYLDQQFVLKVIKSSTHILKNYMSEEDAIQHSLDMVKLFSERGLGPKLIDSFISNNNLIIITELMTPIKPYDSDEVIQFKPEVVNAIKSRIKEMHNSGIIHGDLHEKNIVIDKNGKYYFIDVDTSFTICDFFTREWPKRWIFDGFEIDNFIDFINYEMVNFSGLL